MRNARAFRHAVEQGEAAIVALQHPAPEVEKAFMHVMRRQRGRDTIDEGVGHGAVLVAWKILCNPAPAGSMLGCGLYILIQTPSVRCQTDHRRQPVDVLPRLNSKSYVSGQMLVSPATERAFGPSRDSHRRSGSYSDRWYDS